MTNRKVLFFSLSLFFVLGITGCMNEETSLSSGSMETGTVKSSEKIPKADSYYDQDSDSEEEDSKALSKVGTGLWLSDTKDNNGEDCGIYFVAGKDLLLMGGVNDDHGDGYFIKGNPYSFKINSSGISVKAGYGYGSAIVEDEEREGIPELEIDGDNIICIGGEYDGMVFSYVSDTCRYVVDN